MEGDWKANVMYYAWREHHLRPSEFYKMDKGELEVLKAFYVIDMESRSKR